MDPVFSDRYSGLMIEALPVQKQKKKTNNWLTRLFNKIFKSMQPPNHEELYQHILKHYHVVEGKLFFNKTKFCTGFLDMEIKSGLETAFNNANQDKKSFKFWCDSKRDKKYLIKRLAYGSNARIYLFMDLVDSVAGVFKKARKGNYLIPYNRTREQIENECRILSIIHQKGAVLGIQEKPYGLYNLQVMKIKDDLSTMVNKYGYVGPRYDHNYWDEINTNKSPSEEVVLFEFYQLASALCHLVIYGITHGDLGANNILVRKKDGMNNLFIADFGEARCEDDDIPLVQFVAAVGRMSTDIYTLHIDSQIGKSLVLENDKPAIIALEMARDVYSLGVVMTERLKYARGNLLNELWPFIESMKRDDYRKRPSAIEVFKTIDNLMHQKYPDLANLLQIYP